MSSIVFETDWAMNSGKSQGGLIHYRIKKSRKPICLPGFILVETLGLMIVKVYGNLLSTYASSFTSCS